MAKKHREHSAGSSPEQSGAVIETKLKPASHFVEALRDLTNYLFTRVHVSFRGTENLQNISKPIIFAVAPHNGHPDSLFTRRALGKANKKIQKNSFFIAAGDGYWDKQPRKLLSQLSLRAYPISRQGGKETQKGKQEIIQLLRAGNHPVVFPEGTRSRNPQTSLRERKFKTGIAQIAAATRDLGTVIVPIYLDGAAQVMSPGSALPKFREQPGSPKFSVSITIGKPIDVAKIIPNNFDNLSEEEQYQILKQVTELLHGFFIAQEEFSHRNQQKFQAY